MGEAAADDADVHMEGACDVSDVPASRRHRLFFVCACASHVGLANIRILDFAKTYIPLYIRVCT
jgi:hypothetical protein